MSDNGQRGQRVYIMESELLIGWDAERAELKAELSRLEEELAESRAETEELRSRTNVLTERLSQTLDSSVSIHWESEQREWRKKLREGRERESRQALLIQKLQQKVIEYRSRCEHLQQRLKTEEREMRVRERILQDERSDSLETTLIRLEEEQQRSVTLVEVNALLRCELSQSAEANQALQEDLKKLTADWSKAVEEAGHKEIDWNVEKEVLSAHIEAERSRLMSLWSRVVALKRQCHAVKVATDKDLWELRAEFTRLSSTFLSLNVLPALSTTHSPPPPPLAHTSGPMTLAELDHDLNVEKLKSRINELTAVVKSQELERQRQDEAMKISNRKEEKERELQQEKYRELERHMESITQAMGKLYRALGAQRSDAHRVFPDSGVFGDDLHSVLWVISEAESAFQMGRQDVQEAEGKWRRLKVETESLQQQITALENEKVALQKQASSEALALKQTQSLLSSEKETTLSLKRQLDESECRSEDLKRENVRLIQQREREDEERSGMESERQKRIEAKLVGDAHLCEQQSRTRIELHTLQVALEQERMESARAEKELADTRDALAKTRESLLSLSSTHALLQRETADTRDSLEKMARLNESLAQDKRELSAQNLQLEEQVTESQLQVQCLQSDVASLQKELNAVSEENGELRACRNADMENLHLLRGRERELEEELQILREERERDSNALTDEKMKNEQLSEQCRGVGEKLRTMKGKLDKELDQEKMAQRVIEELQREKQRLEEQVHSMGQEKKEMKQDREELGILTGNLQQQLCAAKEQISVLEVQHTQLQMQVHALQQAKDVLHGEIMCLQSELEEEKRRALEAHRQHEKEIENFKIEIRRLNAEGQTLLNNQRIHEEDRESWQREREALNSELGVKDGETLALKNRMDGLMKENEKLAILIVEKDGDVETLLSEIRSLELQMQEAKAKMEQLKEKVIDFEKEKEELLERMRQDSEVLNISKEENVKMTNILKIRDGEIEKNSKHIEDLMENIRLQDGLIEKIKRELDEKDIVIADKINREKIMQKEREAEERGKELKLKGELKLKENELERLKENVEELTMEKEHMSHLLQERDTYLEKLKSKVVDLEQKEIKTKDEIEWWKEKVGDVVKQKEVLMDRVKKHISVEQEKNELADILQEREEEIKILKKNEEDMQSDHERIKEEYREQEKKLKQRDGEIEEHRNTIVRMMEEKHEQEKLKIQLDGLKREKNSLEDKRNQLEEAEQRMMEEINELRVKIGELDREKCEVERKVLEQKDQLQIQTVLLKEREVDLNKLRETLEQKEQQENEELMTLKEKLNETKLVQEKERNIQKEYDQKLQVAKNKIAIVEEKVKELEVKNKDLMQEADVARKSLLEKLRELEIKSKLLHENEEKMKTLKLRMEKGEEGKEELKRSFREMNGETGRLKIELKERKEKEETLRLELQQQILNLVEDLTRKDSVIEKMDLILEQKEEELKQAKKNKDAMSTEVTKLRGELSVLFLSKEKAETMVKERDIENKKMKDGIKAGLEEMVTLKELLEESRSEGEKLRKILEEKINDKIKERKEEVRAAREETEYLNLRVQILQKKNEDLQAQLWIREENDIKTKYEVEDVKKMEAGVQETLKSTLQEDVTDKNKLKNHELLKDQKNKRPNQLKEEEREINRINDPLEEQEMNMLESKMEKKTISFELVKDKRETDPMKNKIKSNNRMDHVEKQSDEKDIKLVIIPEIEEEHARDLLREKLKDAQIETDIVKRQMERKKQNVTTYLEKSTFVEKIHSQFQENFTIVNVQTKKDFETKESQSQTQMKENIELQAKVYDLKKEADELRKDRDRIRSALEKNEAMLIHYQEKVHQLENKVQVVSSCEEESQNRVCALQRAVAELELKLMKLQQKNERLEHRIEKLRLEKTNLRETLKQVELEREKLQCQLARPEAEIQDCSSPLGADELKYLRSRARELTAQVHQLRLLLASDHQERADFIEESLKNSKSLQMLRQDLNDSLTLVSKQLAPTVLECETQRLDRSIREEQLKILLSHS
ncbi:uncharacterized protein Hap1MRO34_006362 [Clarias gariepinus]